MPKWIVIVALSVAGAHLGPAVAGEGARGGQRAPQAPVDGGAEEAGPCAALGPLLEQAGQPGGVAAPGRLPLQEVELTLDPQGEISGRTRLTLPAAGIREGRALLLLPQGAPDLALSKPKGAWSGHSAQVTPKLEPTEGGVWVHFPTPPRGATALSLTFDLSLSLPPLVGRDAVSVMLARASGAPAPPLGHAGRGPGLGLTLSSVAPVWAAAPAPAAPWGPPPVGRLSCQILMVEAPPSLEVIASGVRVSRLPAGELVRHVYLAAGARRMSLALRPATPPVGARDEAPRVSGLSPKEAGEVVALIEAAESRLEALLGPPPIAPLRAATVALHPSLAGLRGAGVVWINGAIFGGARSPMAALGGAPGPGPTQPKQLTLVVAHQVAHQWFGEGAVAGGPGAPCLEELTAQLAEAHVLSALEGAGVGQAALEARSRGGLRLWQALGGDERPVRGASAQGFESVEGWMGQCEAKAAGLAAGLLKAIGAEAVGAGLKTLYAGRREGPIERPEVEAAFAAAGEEKVRALFSRWWDEGRAPVPSALGGKPGPDREAEALLQLLRGLGAAP